MAERKPNVLFIITDQQRADHNGFMGNEVVRTPNLDAIAARGMVFDNAWVSNPVCMPNRSTIMTGRMPSAHGVIFNDRSLELGAATHVRQFRQAGYRTALIGKSHLQHGMSRNAVMDRAMAPTIDHGYPTGWDELEHHEHYENGAPAFPDDFYGFGHVELSIDHGARVSGHHLLWALDKGGSRDDLHVEYGESAPGSRRSEHWWQIYQPPYAEEFHSTEFVTERTIAFIDDAADGDEPWYAWASFPDPHHPLTPPGRWFDRHDPADMPLPESFGDPLEHVPTFLQRFSHIPAEEQWGWVGPLGARDPDFVRQCIAATYGMIEFVDHGVGRILAAIEAKGQLDDTIIVFTTDHGDQMGDHSLMTKGQMHFRGCLQAPMVIVDPRRPAGRTSSLSSSIDLGSTLMELCDVPTHDGIQGHSLVPILDDPSASVRDHVLIEEDFRRAFAEMVRMPAKSRSLIWEDGMKYTRHSGNRTMLFDLEADPHEMNELGHIDPAAKALADDRLADALMEAVDDSRGAPVA